MIPYAFAAAALIVTACAETFTDGTAIFWQRARSSIVLIVGSLVYLSALERLRDFAVFKAIGVPTRSILAGLALQAVVVALLAAVLGVILAQLLAPLFPMTVVIPASAYLALPLVAILVGLLASLAGLRRAVTVDPALAFGGP